MPRGRVPCSLILSTDPFHSPDDAVRNRAAVSRGGTSHQGRAASFIDLSAMILILLSWKRHHGIQEPRHVGDEQRGILILRPVIGIGIKDELCVGQVLLKNERIYGI